MKLKTTLLAAAASIAIAPAANAYEGLYGAIGAGLNYLQSDRDLSNDALGAAAGPLIFDSNIDFDAGIGIYSALGYAWGNDWRTELEFSYRNNDARRIASDGAGFSGIPEGSLAGDVRTYALMLNVIRDLNFGNELPFTPYVGGGVGFADIGFDVSGVNQLGAPTAPLSIAFGPSRRAFAYQGIAGIAWPLAEDLALDLSYRFFGTNKIAYDAVINGAAAEVEAGYHTHSFFAGLRWNFGAAAPIPVQYKDCWDGSSIPVTSECPPEVIDNVVEAAEPIQFIVYFDYDKSNLTPQASSLVQEAASRALQFDVDSVVIAGNTDTSGSSAYNQALSERRARIVRDALIANGISADAIRTEAFGESNPAKPTSDGVREPLNRRSEVVISFE